MGELKTLLLTLVANFNQVAFFFSHKDYVVEHACYKNAQKASTLARQVFILIRFAMNLNLSFATIVLRRIHRK